MSETKVKGFITDVVLTLEDGRQVMRHGKPITIGEFTELTPHQQGCTLRSNNMDKEAVGVIIANVKKAWSKKKKKEITEKYKATMEPRKEEQREKVKAGLAAMTEEQKAAKIAKYKITMTPEKMAAKTKKRLATMAAKKAQKA